MGLLLALGLRPMASRRDVVPDARPAMHDATNAPGPAGAPAAPGGGGREYAPARITQSQRTFIRENLVTSALAKSVQGDVSAQLGHKAAAESTIAGRAKVYAGLDAANYQRLRTLVQAQVVALDAHAAKASVTTSIKDAKAKLADSDTAHTAGKRGDASMRAAEAQAICDSAKALADQVEAFGQARDAVLAELFALDGVDDQIQKWVGFVNDAYKTAKGPPPDVPGGLAALTGVKEGLAARIKMLVDEERARLTAIDAMSAGAKTAVAGDLAEGRRLIGVADAALAKSEWSACLIALTAARDFLAPSLRMAGRRNGYDTQRVATSTLVDKVKGDPAIQAQAPALAVRVAQADQLADVKAQKFEEGQRALAEVAVRCQAWLDASASIGEVNTTVAAVDKAMVELAAGPSAQATKALRDSAQAQRDDAAKMLTLASGGNDLARGVASALAAARHASQDIAQAKALADALKASQKANAASAKPTDLTGLKTALKALRADLAAARAAKPPAAAEAEFVKVDAAATDTDTALAKKDGKAAAAALSKAAQSLADGRTVAVAQAQFDTLAAALDQRRTALLALPNALSIQPQIDALDRALAQARGASGANAITALRKAEDAATTAEHAAAERSAFETEANAVSQLLGGVGDAKLIADVRKQIDAARAKSQALKFAEALKMLVAARVEADRGRMKALSAARPPKPADIAAVAADLAKHGAGGDVDALLKVLPPGTDPRAAAALLQGRFNVEVTLDFAPGAAAHELASVKEIGKMLATVPRDAADNPSLRKIVHTDAPDKPGGSYDQRDASMRMRGRVNTEHQQFGSKLKAPSGAPVPPGRDPVMVDQLPSDIDPKCKPENEDQIDVLDWASLHEVGHGIDDKHKYMLRHQSAPDHGGWTSYGSDVKKVADVIGPHFRFYTTPEQQKYVLDKLMNVPPVDPPAPDTKTNWAARKTDFDKWHEIATSDGVYRREADCKTITIGGTLIFHEAYPRQWVSYLAAARKQGLTGYQFKHPGEWFSELYAGYKSGKLGKQHPARAFLEKLSP
jgi:hypothetical protein